MFQMLRSLFSRKNVPEQWNDLWTTEGRRLDGLIPANWILYGELIGWVDSATPIQKNYVYDCPPGTRKLFIYRVSVVNEQGTVVDLSWDAVKEFCASIGVAHVPELWRGPLYKLQDRQVPDMGAAGPTMLETEFLDTKYRERGYANALPLAPESVCDEGVVIRIDDGMIPTMVKAKSPAFLRHETKILDQGIADIESTEALDGSV